MKKGPNHNQMTLYHCNATMPVSYCVSGWRKECLEHPLIRSAASVLKDSQKKEVSELFVMSWGAGLTSSLTGSVVGLEGLQTLRKGSSLHRTATTALKRKSFSLQFKFVVDGLVDTLKRTRIKFVQCLIPHQTAGLSETLVPAHHSSAPQPDCLIDIPLLRNQIRGSRILDAVRLHRQGFPKSMSLQEFARRLHLLAPSVVVEDNQERAAVEEMASSLDLDPATYRIGVTKYMKWSSPSLITLLKWKCSAQRKFKCPDITNDYAMYSDLRREVKVELDHVERRHSRILNSNRQTSHIM
ncbi:positive regulation of opsonization [Homalodisca vitripennis]|nr:positive regulation of opsonization [Homalodisca vitripennis]